jgi:undecaprenyl-diphosphatase
VARVVLWLGASIVVLLIGTSRMYLGAHWFTDVLGGYALGGLWLSVLVAVVLVMAARRSRMREPTTPPPELARR